MNGKIFAIAGSDPSGGAGIQADIKTISALGGYGMAAITALTVQNSLQVHDVYPVPADIVAAQVETVIEDILPDAFKVGMMATADTAKQLARIFSDNHHIPLIIDPVILSTSGHPLLETRGVEILLSDIFPLIDLLTPNLAEAALLADMGEITTLSQMTQAGQKLLSLGPKAILVKGGHLPERGDANSDSNSNTVPGTIVLTDLLVTEAGLYEFSSPRIRTNNTHGTGCTLASAIATGIGQGMTLTEAVARGHKYVHKAILQAPGFGRGHGPLNHLVTLD
ncbi:MAG: bifunctional hydroxymethylpyrimidine kinase/phosphomethylpyrimidine kinase [Emcibacter sp.]|nr:bifunctional hydroxymethylpyrimidine kinase/phosphomethylpyrimidine kinase [Emcibacter sp.]